MRPARPGVTPSYAAELTNRTASIRKRHLHIKLQRDQSYPLLLRCSQAPW
jgi:hypothetical protein